MNEEGETSAIICMESENNLRGEKQRNSLLRLVLFPSGGCVSMQQGAKIMLDN